MNEEIALVVKELLAKNNDGHGFDHIERVVSLAENFLKTEDADEEIVILACLLHDVDDYKLFGKEYSEHLINANKILNDFKVEDAKKMAVLEIIRTMGYSKYLDGIRPTSVEGKLVSDADMCDAIGAVGILRTYAYSLSKGAPFFDKQILPSVTHLSSQEYTTNNATHSVQHFFDKLFKLAEIMLTEAGKKEAAKRQKIMHDFLRELFREENALEWRRYLDEYDGLK